MCNCSNKQRTDIMDVKKILHKRESGESYGKINEFVKSSKSTVYRIYKKAENLDPDVRELLSMPSVELEKIMFPGKKKKKFNEPDWSYIKKEHTRKDVNVTLKQLFKEYKEEFNNENVMGYTSFTIRYKEYNSSLEYVMLMDHEPGKRCFVDYAGKTLTYYDPDIEQERKAYFFVGQLGASNLIYTEPTEDMKQMSWSTAHINMFSYFGGVPEEAVPDNFKTSVIKPSIYDPKINKSYNELSFHYGMEIVPARVYRPKDKGKVEAGVKLVEQQVMAPLRNRKFNGIGELKEAVKEKLEELNNRQLTGMDKSRKELFNEIESDKLKALPEIPFEDGKWFSRTLQNHYHIDVDGHKYSVHYDYVSKKLDIKVTQSVIYIYYQGELITSHLRSNRKGNKTTKESHRAPAHKAYKNSQTSEYILNESEKLGSHIFNFMFKQLEGRRSILSTYRYLQGLKNLARIYTQTNLEIAFKLLDESSRERPLLERIESILINYKLHFSERDNCFKSLKNNNVRGASYYAAEEDINGGVDDIGTDRRKTVTNEIERNAECIEKFTGGYQL